MSATAPEPALTLTLTRERVLEAARAVAAEDEDRAGVATYLALVDRTTPAPGPTTAGRADDARLA
ncbi:MAG: hypothetical protein AVDCRST_MAG35-1341, partial [uncultured Quadrisphaera sp.]